MRLRSWLHEVKELVSVQVVMELVIGNVLALWLGEW